MTNLVQSVGTIVNAGVQGLIDLAEGYLHDEATTSDPQIPMDPSSTGPTPARAIETSSNTSNHSVPASAASSLSTQSHISSVASSIPPTDNLVETIDVPSGWIHIPAAYLDESGGQRTVKSFGLRNLSREKEVQVEVGSDMREQVSFWLNDDEVANDSATSSASSTSSSPSPGVSTVLPSGDSCVVWIAFQPTPQAQGVSSFQQALDTIDATPRALPTQPRPSAQDTISPPPSLSSVTRLSGEGSINSVSGSVSNRSSVPSAGGRKQEQIHRAFSVHGLITIRAATMLEVAPLEPEGRLVPATPTTMLSRQNLSIPLFATVCRSFFTVALIDTISGRTLGNQLSSGRLELDFGPDSVIGGEYHRDILLVNRSEVELVWSTAVVNCRNKDAVWFSLRDLDSENVFGIDTSSQPVPLPPLSSRHLRLELRVRQPIADFDFDFILSNVNQPGNVVTCHVIGSGVAEIGENPLKILSESSVDFGEICDGVWSRKVISCKNTGDKPIDVRFSATEGYEVVFRLAGVAGDDMDEEVPNASTSKLSRRPVRSGSGSDKRVPSESRRGRELSVSRSRKSSRCASPSSSVGIDSSSLGDEHSPYMSASFPVNLSSDLSKHLSALDGPRSLPGRSMLHETRSASGIRDTSQPPSRALSRVTSRTSSYMHHNGGESDIEEDESAIEPSLVSISSDAGLSSSPPADSIHSAGSGGLAEVADQSMPNQIEELTMRPGTEYRILFLYRPAKDTSNPPDIAGALRESDFRVYLDSTTSSGRATNNSRRTIKCTAKSCTSLISISSGGVIDFGQVTVGASKNAMITIKNHSALSARVEIAAISKVLSANRNVIVIPPFESVEERIEFFPRRINERYEKQIFVRNLLNRVNDQLLEIRSKNVDVYNLTIHSHLYRILTPSGSNFLDFGSVIINSPTIRTVHFDNLTFAPLLLELTASQPEDVELFIKVEDAPANKNGLKPASVLTGNYALADSGIVERAVSPPNGNGELKERFMETMRELSVKAEKGEQPVKAASKAAKSKTKEKTEQVKKEGEDAGSASGKASIGASMVSALKKGSRGRPVQLYGNAVIYKDRSLLEDHEYLDLAAGPPVAAHRSSPRSKRTILLDTIELEDKSKLSGQHPKIPKLDFAAGAKATGLFSKDAKVKKHKTASNIASPKALPPSTPTKGQSASPLTRSDEPPPSLASVVTAMANLDTALSTKSPALTAKRVEPKDVATGDVSKMTVDELLIAIEQQDSQKSSITHSTLEEEEAYVRRHTSLRKELANLVSTDALVPARNMTVPPRSSCKLIVIMTPNGSTRPHISTKSKRADSRIFIKLVDFDKGLLCNAAGATTDLGDLPVRDLVIRSNCVRSVLEVGQSSINFGSCDKGQVKSKTIVVQNKSDCIGMFRLRTSGSIASGDLKLATGRYGVISAFGRKEFEGFSFTPSLTGNYQETLIVENVLDGWNDQKVAIKAVVRKVPAMTLDLTTIDFGIVNVDNGAKIEPIGFVVTNVSKHERTFIIETKAMKQKSGAGGGEGIATEKTLTTGTTGTNGTTATIVSLDEDDQKEDQYGAAVPFADISLVRDEKGGGVALSKGEEEEVEKILQKLKIARRKGKADKVEKYEKRLDELGVRPPGSGKDDASDAEEAASVAGSMSGTPVEEAPPPVFVMEEEKRAVTMLSITLGPNQKSKILVELWPKSTRGVLERGGKEGPVECVISVHDKKNTDETLSINVKAAKAGMMVGGMEQGSATSSLSSGSISSKEPLHQAIMRHCLKLTLSCPVSQTAFCVGSTLFLPDTSDLYPILKPHFKAFPEDDPDPSGLILADGYSREIPGNTHAEANALTNFRKFYAELLTRLSANVPAANTTLISSSPESSSAVQTQRSLPPIEQVLKEVDCYATMEPCSYRTSGGPSCALELVKAKVKRVYLGVEEPADFVQCEGVQILQQGGVEVGRVAGLEEDCLRMARRGRN